MQEVVEKLKLGGVDILEQDSDDKVALNSLLELIFVVQNHPKIERRYFKTRDEDEFGGQEAVQVLYGGIDKQPKLAEKDKDKIELQKLLSSQNEFIKEEEEEF